MIRRNLYFLVFILVFSILSSCNKNDDKDNPFLHYIDLEYFEMFSAEGPTLYLQFKTLEIFPCSNFTLDVLVTPSGTNHTDINISNIDVPDVCITAMGPATYLLPIPIPADADYTVWVNEKRHDFKIKTNPAKISILPGKHFDNHLFFAYDSLMRIPEGTIWGYALFDPSEKRIDIWARILEAFEEAGAKQTILADGNYYYFGVKEHIISFENIKQNSQTFYFHFDNEIDKLVSIYQDIKSEYQNPEFQLRLFSTNGDRLVL